MMTCILGERHYVFISLIGVAKQGDFLSSFSLSRPVFSVMSSGSEHQPEHQDDRHDHDQNNQQQDADLATERALAVFRLLLVD
jgi:hypothetical protein